MSFDAGQFWEKRLARLSNLEGVGSEGRSLAWNKILYRTKTRCLVRMFDRHNLTPENRAVLDVGCGFGGMGHYLMNRYGTISYTGIDISEQMIEEGKRLYPDLRMLQRNILEMPLHEPFDVVLAQGIFYLLGDG